MSQSQNLLRYTFLCFILSSPSAQHGIYLGISNLFSYHACDNDERSMTFLNGAPTTYDLLCYTCTYAPFRKSLSKIFLVGPITFLCEFTIYKKSQNNLSKRDFKKPTSQRLKGPNSGPLIS